MDPGSRNTQTPKEETLNAISHGLTLALGLFALPFLIIRSANTTSGLGLIGLIIFAIAIILLYVSSTIYHILPVGKWKDIFKKVDHSAIFVLIAGTYTPFSLGILSDHGGKMLFSIVWILAIAGIGLNISGKLENKKLSNFLYLMMGWLGLLFVKPIIEEVPVQGIFLLAMGGVFYSLGVFFYAKDHKKYFHFIWHIFVSAGSIFHFMAIYSVTGFE